MKHHIYRMLFSLFVLSYLAGCTTSNTFGLAGRANDTMVFTAGWIPDLTANDITVSITDSLSIQHPVVPRAVVNLYPDPLSNLIVEKFYTANVFDFNSGLFWGTQMEDYVTNGDQDYSLKLIVFDLPGTVNPGAATVDITGPGISADPIEVEVLPGAGKSNDFSIQETLPSSPTLGVSFGDNLRLAERAPHFVVSFTGSTVPHAIEIDLLHDTDSTIGGNGLTYVTSSRADVKNVSWTDDGANLTVILTPSNYTGSAVIDDFSDFKFFVAGGITGLSVVSVKAFDIDGNEMSGIIGQVN